MTTVGAIPIAGTAGEPPRNPVLDRLRTEKREAVDAAMGKGESWTTKLINGESGVRLVDLPSLLHILGLKVVPAEALYVDREVAHAYELIARKAINARSLLVDE